MPSTTHLAVFVDNASEKSRFLDTLLEVNSQNNLKVFAGQKGVLFSPLALKKFISEEERYGTTILTADIDQNLKSMSSGERKKALLRYVLSKNPDYIVLDNPFDNLDAETQAALGIQFEKISRKTAILQLLSRRADLLPFINQLAWLKGSRLIFREDEHSDASEDRSHLAGEKFNLDIPPPLHPVDLEADVLIELKSVNVSYGNKTILDNIDWTVSKGEFWELRGKNGSGKTTILSMITGDNPKGYGQELYIFGRKKGSGESIWDIKKNIGYFTPSMTDLFMGYHSVENMIISGLNDSVGLYIKPTEAQLRLAEQWLQLVGLTDAKEQNFQNLSMGQKRLVMCARAMVKHPPLLILDEPTAGLDDASASLFVDLVNAFARESETTLIFVSHRKEPGLEPRFIYELQMMPTGSVGRLLK